MPAVIPLVAYRDRSRRTSPLRLLELIDPGPADKQAMQPWLPRFGLLPDDLTRADEDQLAEMLEAPGKALGKAEDILAVFEQRGMDVDGRSREPIESCTDLDTLNGWFRRAFKVGKASAGLIAGATLALTPAATLIFRLDDPDALLTLTVTLAGYAMTRAVESGRTSWVVLAGVFLGTGFLAKFMAAFMVLPALALSYLWAGPPRLARRAAQRSSAWSPRTRSTTS